MTQDKKVFIAEIEKIKKEDVELFKSILIPFHGVFANYNKERESAIVVFKKPIELKHLDALGSYTINTIECYNTNEDTNNEFKTRQRSSIIKERVALNKYDIIHICLNSLIMVPITFISMCLLVFICLL